MSLTPGSKLGRYEILAPLGAGGMGEVYRSRDSGLDRDVALKVIAHDHAHDAELIRRFEQEARAAGALNHPNVCAIYDLGAHEGLRYVVMELLEGETLRAVLGGRPLPLRSAIAYGARAAEGLAAAHAHGIVHRDLKPENLFLTKSGQVKVLDFGLAKLKPAGISDAASGAATVPPERATSPGVILGTVSYMAPEQIRGASVDARTDVFALGVVLFELLAGRRPFVGATAADVMSGILEREAPPLETLRADTPAPLARLVRRCLAKDPNRRVQTSLDVRNELEDLLQELDRPVPPGGDSRPADLAERSHVLTAAEVRQLSVRNPRLVGYPMAFVDNRRDSDTLVVCLHGVGGDHRRFEGTIRAMPYRGVALSLAGFAPGDGYRPVLPFDDHSRLVRILLQSLVREQRPARTILVGFSAGADQFLRMLVSPGGLGIDAAGFVGLGTNINMETCFVSSRYASLDPENPNSALQSIKAFGEAARDLPSWLVIQSYLVQTFQKFGLDLEPLKRYSADLVAPFENGGDPMPGWYRAATETFPCVRFVFSDAEAAPAEAVLARHLEQNVLGDRYTERSYVTEPISHSRLPEPALACRYIEEVVTELTGARRR